MHFHTEIYDNSNCLMSYQVNIYRRSRTELRLIETKIKFFDYFKYLNPRNCDLKVQKQQCTRNIKK